MKTFSRMPHRSIVSLTALAVLGISAQALSLRPAAAPAALAPKRAEESKADPKVERGAYLVKIMACNDCHTPWKMGPQGPEPDMTRMLSGHPESAHLPPSLPRMGEPWQWAGTGTNTAFVGPWGVSFTANLTPDRETGLGKWNEETFIKTIRTGRHEGQGRPILPPMPYPMYRQATDEDLSAVFAFLQSIPPIRNRVPQPVDPPESE
jgi:hypothetical protein